MLLTIVFRVLLTGFMDQAKLDGVCQALDMKQCGRLTDPMDAEIGRRMLHYGPTGWSNLALWRRDDSHWSVRLAYFKEPIASEIVEQSHRKVMAVANEFSFNAQDQVPPLPMF